MREWIDVVAISSLADGRRHTSVIKGRSILVFNLQGKFYAIEDCCTHQGLPLSEGELEGNEITCPFHGAKFNIITGEVTEPPAFEDLVTFETRVVAGMIQVLIEE